MTSAFPHLDYAAFMKAAPDIHAALIAFGKATAAGGVEETTLEFVKARVSQINGCAFCLQFHFNKLREAGASAQKIDLLATWREAGFFSPRELAALALAEHLTLRPGDERPAALDAAVTQAFSSAEIVTLVAAIAGINSWNRIAAPLGFPPLPRKG